MRRYRVVVAENRRFSRERCVPQVVQVLRFRHPSMDIRKPHQKRNRRVALVLTAACVVTVLMLLRTALVAWDIAGPTVDRSTQWIDTVKRGELVCQVEGAGTLVPEQVRWITAGTDAIVVAILLPVGAVVSPESVIIRLANPRLTEEIRTAELKLRSAEAALEVFTAQTENEVLARRTTLAGIEADYTHVSMQSEINEALAQKQLISAVALRQSQTERRQLEERFRMAKEQVANAAIVDRAQLTLQQLALDQARVQLSLLRQEEATLQVQAGVAGVLQAIPTEIAIGRKVAPGADLAQVADPSKLKAQIQIPEAQAKDILVGQKATIDTRTGYVAGHVSRIAPSVVGGTRTVDLSLDEALPAGAVPDISVTGNIELQRLTDVLYVTRPATVQQNSTAQVFRLKNDKYAERVTVAFGRVSTSSIEVRSGLSIGDRVILSDDSNLRDEAGIHLR